MNDDDETTSILLPNDFAQWRSTISSLSNKSPLANNHDNNHDDELVDHDIRDLLTNKDHHDTSWRHTEDELARRGIYNWFQIRQALKNHQHAITSGSQSIHNKYNHNNSNAAAAFKFIEEANVFDDLPTEELNERDMMGVGDDEDRGSSRRMLVDNVMALASNPKAVEQMQQQRLNNWMLKQSIPRTVEYWRRMERDMAENSGLPNHIRTYQLPQMRLHHRIQQPDLSKVHPVNNNKNNNITAPT